MQAESRILSTWRHGTKMTRIEKPDNEPRPIADVKNGTYLLAVGRHRLRESDGSIYDVIVQNEVKINIGTGWKSFDFTRICLCCKRDLP